MTLKWILSDPFTIDWLSNILISWDNFISKECHLLQKKLSANICAKTKFLEQIILYDKCFSVNNISISATLRLYLMLLINLLAHSKPVKTLLLWSMDKRVVYSLNHSIGTSVQRSSRSAFGRLTGNDVSGHYKHHHFPFILRHNLFFIEGVLGSKNLLRHLSRLHP